MCRVRVPRAECAGTRACVSTDVTDGRGQTDGWTDGKHSGMHTHSSAGAKRSMHGGAGTPHQRLRVCARAAGALTQQAKARARLPARPGGVGTLTTGDGLGGRGRVKPARGWGGTLVPTLLIERDSCLYRHTTAKETALGENNNKKSPNPQNNKYIQHLLPPANVWQELSGLQDYKTAGEIVSKSSGRKPPFHSMRMGMEEPVQSVVQVRCFQLCQDSQQRARDRIRPFRRGGWCLQLGVEVYDLGHPKRSPWQARASTSIKSRALALS